MTIEYKANPRLESYSPEHIAFLDFIIGFPGESEQDFLGTMKLIEDIGFDTSFSFIYSARPGTPASDLADDTPECGKSAYSCFRHVSTNKRWRSVVVWWGRRSESWLRRVKKDRGNWRAGQRTTAL